MQEPLERKSGTPLASKETEQCFRLREMLFEFSRLFDYGEASDRAVAIVGPAFLDTLLTEMLVNFLIDDKKEVDRLMLFKYLDESYASDSSGRLFPHPKSLRTSLKDSLARSVYGRATLGLDKEHSRKRLVLQPSPELSLPMATWSACWPA